MNISVCISVLNEERSIGELLRSLLSGSRKPNEIIIIDAGSIDQTNEIINHYRKKNSGIKLVIEKNISRSKARNLAIDMAQNEIIAMTDAGCVVKRRWLERISDPFRNRQVDMVAGFYQMTGKKPVQKAFSVFLGTLPGKFDANFLPSTRSVAFRKKVWEEIGGFPEKLEDTAEDTEFNANAVRLGLRITRVKNARVEWRMPISIKDGIKKIYSYARGDAKSGIWYHPVKGLMSHNIKSLSKVFRYLIFILLLIFSVKTPLLLVPTLLLIFLYALWAFRKVYSEYNDMKAGLCGIIIQFASDIAVIFGFFNGIVKK